MRKRRGGGGRGPIGGDAGLLGSGRYLLGGGEGERYGDLGGDEPL